MLRVTAILEGGLNLETGEEITRSIVVSNGASSVTVPVPESKIRELVELFAKELQGRVPVREEAPPSPPRAEPKFKGPRPMKPLFEPEPELEAPSLVDEQDFQPGEEYEESGTGVASL